MGKIITTYQEGFMETYALIVFIWIVGWLYSCGIHSGRAKDVDYTNVTKVTAYAVLFFGWPHYLGYGK